MKKKLKFSFVAASVIFVFAVASMKMTGQFTPPSGGGGTGAVWGLITGTLSAQTDLNNALAAKAPTSSPTFTGPVTISGTGVIDYPCITTPTAPTTGSVTPFCNSANSNHWSVVNPAGTVTDLQAFASLTTTGSSGAASLSGGVLNIPVYTGGGGGLPQSWTIVNSAVLNNFTPGVIDNSVANSGSVSWRFLTQTLPSLPYTAIATINCLNPWANTSSCGLYLYDGTKWEGIEIIFQASSVTQLRVEKGANVTTDTGSLAGPTNGVVGKLLTVKIVDDSTHRTFYYYTNGAYTQFFQETTATFLTPTQVGFGGTSIGTGTTSEQLITWSLTSP